MGMSIAEMIRTTIPPTERKQQAERWVAEYMTNRNEDSEYIFLSPILYQSLFARVWGKFKEYCQDYETEKARRKVFDFIIFKMGWSKDGNSYGLKQGLHLCSKLNELLDNPLPENELGAVLVEVIAEHRIPKEEQLANYEIIRAEKMKRKIKTYKTDETVEAKVEDIERITEYIKTTTSDIDSLAVDESEKIKLRKQRLTLRAIRFRLGYHRAKNREAGNNAIRYMKGMGMIQERQAESLSRAYIVELFPDDE